MKSAALYILNTARLETALDATDLKQMAQIKISSLG